MPLVRLSTRQTARLSPKELALLVHLLEHPDQVHSRSQLLQKIWGVDATAAAETRTVDVHVSRLRRKVGAPHRARIQTVHGIGYRYRSRPTRDDAPQIVAARLAQQRSLWQPHVRFDLAKRHYSRIADNEHWEAWLLTWLPGQGTGIHDHGGSSGAFVVLSGALTERSWPTEVGDAVTRTLAPQRIRSFGGELVHEVTNRGSVPAVSLHVYQPRLTTMRRYLDGSADPVDEVRVGRDW